MTGITHDNGKRFDNASVTTPLEFDDLARLTVLGPDAIDVDLRLSDDSDSPAASLRLYTGGLRAPLSKILPIFDGLGIEVIEEHPYSVRLDNGAVGRVFGFDITLPDAARDHPGIGTEIAAAFSAIWAGQVESDRLNALVTEVGLSCRQVVVLRMYTHFLRQTPIGVTPGRIEQILRDNAETSAALVHLFEILHDPEHDPTTRGRRAEQATVELLEAIDAVRELDADRVLRTLLELINATLRTTFFVTDLTNADDNCVAVKLDSRSVGLLPQPRPHFETFVYSPRVEGAHLRLGSVARGGLRWSDRREDFRTEILGLVKAQAVKNSVIVPAGAKGGFVVKRPPAATGDAGADRDALHRGGVECYRQFVSALLRLTDNLDRATGEVSPAPGIVRHDGDDSYLVVAADKGTATFSDIANAESVRHGFWLGDAFASGGSVGYDHKAMGITARGAWVSVTRHFRELGIDVDTDDITAVGIGDMSGDVFGNGMLCSPHVRLVAAFNHRHIFIDPDPDAAQSYTERRRLFDTPRSSWADYSPDLISRGGGVFDRSSKSVPLTPEIRAALDIAPNTQRLTPAELIRAILTAPVDLLWNGGIGTYAKSDTETHADVGDKSNDDVRVNASELRCRVVGEGGNLGFTQLARIDYSLAGGRINTDAVDNSAGVNCSDHEVNIKIVLDALVDDDRLSDTQRSNLLAAMTESVADLVLTDNHAHNELMGVARTESLALATTYRRLVTALENEAGLDRAVETLPTDKEIAKRIERTGIALTSPELCTVMAYTKLLIKSELLADDTIDDPHFDSMLSDYFPTRLSEGECAGAVAAAIAAHPLRREIVATQLANRIVDIAGITFVQRLREETGATTSDAARAFATVTELFDLHSIWRRIEISGHPTEVTDELVTEARRVIDRATRWLLTNRPQPLQISTSVRRFAPAIAELRANVPHWQQDYDRANVAERTADVLAGGARPDLVDDVYGLLDLFCLLDIVEIGHVTDDSRESIGEMYFLAKDRTQVSRVLMEVSGLRRDDQWNALARLALREELYASTRSLTIDILSTTDSATDVATRFVEWEQVNATRLQRSHSMLAKLDQRQSFDLATLSVAARYIRRMVSQAAQPLTSV